MPTQIVIYTALQMEADAIARRVTDVPIRVIGLHGSRLAHQPDPQGIYILAGLAGALDPALKVGDIMTDDSETSANSVVTSPKPVLTPQAKAELFQTTRARAVDMEGDVVRRFLAGRATRFIHVRAISDTADESIDPAVLGFIDDVGRPQVGKVIATLARRPALLGELRRLRTNSGIALRALSDHVATLVRLLLTPENRP
jgi:hypothetical protein